jgi:SAM-dependent methyltransferase
VRIFRLSKKILDACCGSKMFWFNKEHPDVIYADNRKESHILCDNRELIINPDILIDFRDMPFQDNSFKLVVFDPPHLRQIGDNSWMKKKYGSLGSGWQEDIRKGFKECMRVLEPSGVLIFKWSEVQIKVNEILSIIDTQPLFGHKSGKHSNTHWMCFMKEAGTINYESN